MQTTIVWRIPPEAWAPIGLAIGAESVSNGLRAYMLGTHMQNLTVDVGGVPVSIAGAVLVMAALAISLCQARAAWVVFAPDASKAQRAIAVAFTVLLMSISIIALRSHIQEATRAKTGDEHTAQAAYDRAETAYKAALADYEQVKTAASVAAVKAQMDAIQIDSSIRLRSKNCTEITKRASQDECAPVLRLKPALADAERKEQLESLLPDLKANLDRLTRPETASQSETSAIEFWGWLMGLGVVFIATFGTVIFAKSETVWVEEDVSTKRQPTSYQPPPSGKRGRKRDPKVVDFVSKFRRAHGRNPRIPEMRNEFPQLDKATLWRNAQSG